MRLTVEERQASWLLFLLSLFIFVVTDQWLKRFDWWKTAAKKDSGQMVIILPTLYRVNIARKEQEGVETKLCPYNCRFISYPNATEDDIETADAIVWHLVWTDLNMPEFRWLKKRRKPSQLWGFFSHEPPEVVRAHLPNDYRNHEVRRMQDFRQFNGQFNFTFTYRLDSDVVNPMHWLYDLIGYEEIEEPNNVTVKRFSVSGKKHVGALISNCANRGYDRVGLLKKMSEAGLEVDVYGGCGVPCPIEPPKAGQSEGRESNLYCKNYIAKNYLFFASFENFICPDYITEKFKDTITLDVVPLVVGAGDYSKYAPPHSYVNMRDFASVHTLARFIKKVAANATAYNEYFAWRRKYRLKFNQLSSGCRLCEKLLREKNRGLVTKIYQDFDGWWQRMRPCETSIFNGSL